MTPQHVPDEHHISRLAKNRKVHKDLTGERRVDLEVFRLRPIDEYLSVNWLEYFQGNQRERLDQVRNALIRKEYNVRNNAAFAVVNVNDIKNAGRSNHCGLSVMTMDDQNDPSHSGIYGLPRNPEDEIILQIIAECAKVEDAWG